MTTKLNKLLPLWAGIAAVIILAGAILLGLLGFNESMQNAAAKTVEIKYDVVMTLGENTEEELDKLCESTFSENSLRYDGKRTYTTTTGGAVEYVFSSEADDAALTAAKNALTAALNDGNGVFAEADTFVTVHSTSAFGLDTPQWRGAIALIVGGVVALVYLAIRYGLGKALTGLVLGIVASGVTVGILAITRIPVFGYAPLMLAAIALFLMLVFWTIVCARLKAEEKDPANAALSAEEIVLSAQRACKLPILAIGIALAATLLLLGTFTFGGAGIFFFTALIPVALCMAATYVLAPSVYLPIRKAFDKAAAKRSRYDYGKKEA